MVKLLHHYETTNHRVFLLLEHVRGGRLVDLVTARREQWGQLRAAALNPLTSSSLLLQEPLNQEAEINSECELTVEINRYRVCTKKFAKCVLVRNVFMHCL